MSEEEGKFVVNCPFSVVKVCVTYATCLNINDYFSWPRIRYLNGFDGYRRAFRSSYNAPNFVWHRNTP